MKKILLLLIAILLIFNSVDAQYHVIKYEMQNKGSWDLQFKTEMSISFNNLLIFYFFSYMLVGQELYTLDILNCYVEYENNKYISTSWNAIDSKNLKCKVVFSPKVVKIIYSDNGYYTISNYYLR